MEQTAVEWLFLMLNNPNKDKKFANKLLDKAKEIEKLKIDTKNEEIKDLKSRLDVAKESSAKALKMIEVLEEQDKTKLNEEDVLDLLFALSVDNPTDITQWFNNFKSLRL